jgi:hypothetical protein
MNLAKFLAASLIVCTTVVNTRVASAQSQQSQGKPQAPCSLESALTDSAKDEAMSVLRSNRPLVTELLTEQKMTGDKGLTPVQVINDRFVCARLASAFDHKLQPGAQFAVLRIGKIFYARDPDQTKSTGVFVDDMFKVVMRLGAEVK